MTHESAVAIPAMRTQEATESPFDIWEERLEAEGMPAELPQEMMLADIEHSPRRKNPPKRSTISWL